MSYLYQRISRPGAHFIKIKDTKTEKFPDQKLVDDVVNLSNDVLNATSEIGGMISVALMSHSSEKYNEFIKLCQSWGTQARVIAQLKMTCKEVKYPDPEYYIRSFNTLKANSAYLSEERMAAEKLAIAEDLLSTLKYCSAENTRQLNGGNLTKN